MAHTNGTGRIGSCLWRKPCVQIEKRGRSGMQLMLKRGRLNVVPNALPGVSCHVATCSHHCRGCCTAKHVYIGTEYASDVEDTVCASFERKV